MKTLITAHSGCDGTPDNSLEFVSHALQCGADALEVDVRARPDGSLYLSHDPTEADRPQLEQVFQMLQSSAMRINCDLKEPELEESVLALARSCGTEDRLLFSGSVSMERMILNPEICSRTLLNVRPALPEGDSTIMERKLDELVRTCRACGASVINVSYEMCTDLALERLQEEGIGVSAWTVNDETTARRLLDWKIFNITSRRPRMVMALRAENRIR